MTVSDQQSAPGETAPVTAAAKVSSTRARNVLAALAIFACLGAIALGVWIKRGDDSTLASDRAESNTETAVSAHSTDTPGVAPAEIKFATGTVAKSLGLKVSAVESRPLSGTIGCNGRIAFNQNHYVELRARTDGIVRRIGYDVGAVVGAHDRLALIDSPRIGDLKTAYLNAVKESRQLEWDAARLESLAADQSVAGKNLRQAQTALAQQQTLTANARQQLVNLGFTAEQIESLTIDQDTATELPLEAPWAGTIVAREAVEGEFVDRNARLFAVADLSTMWVYLNLYEADLGKVKIGQSIIFAPDGLGGQTFTGQIDWINPTVDERTRITQARAPVVNTDSHLRANMFGRGKIVVEPEHQALVIPPTAVQDYRGQPVVFVRTSPQTFDVRPVTIGIKLPDAWEILSGAGKGEMVVTTGSFLLRSELEKDKLGEAH
jgi:membrane fusion protein, heavy metal efflux system